MRIETCTSIPDDRLEDYRPPDTSVQWKLVTSGLWEEYPHNSGHIAYLLAKPEDGVWVLDAVERNVELDGVTEEDVEAGRLNDDQLQAMWGMTLEEAQGKEYRRIVAICFDAPANFLREDVATLLLEAIVNADGKRIGEPDGLGMLDQEN